MQSSSGVELEESVELLPAKVAGLSCYWTKHQQTPANSSSAGAPEAEMMKRESLGTNQSTSSGALSGVDDNQNAEVREIFHTRAAIFMIS